MASPIASKTLAGVIETPAQLAYDPPAIPQDPLVMAQQIQQLFNTVNMLIVAFNQLCTDASHAGDAVTGTAASAANLFTAS